MKAPRILLTAPSSGSGKTLITCGILQALVNRGKHTIAFKTGPDYIDPMFHGKIIGIPSKNLDTFFAEEKVVRYLFGKEACKADISVMEGAMGYYDGIAGVETDASAYHVAKVTDTPVILIVNTKGMSLSSAAVIKGFMEFKKDHRIAGVILNRMSENLFTRIKDQLEEELQVKILGYVPKVEEYVIESRHLGLVTPDEVENLQEKLQGLAAILEKTIDMDALIQIAENASEITYEEPELPRISRKVRIGVARDEAFCFCYQDNFEIMEKMGAELVFFSPLKEKQLPTNLDGLIFYGGYPELYAQRLSENISMREEIKRVLDEGKPYLAECGGFMYLHEILEDMDGQAWSMVGKIAGKTYRTRGLKRFGYISLEAKKRQIFGEKGVTCKGHEFHYFDSTSNGDAFLAEKPLVDRSWECIHADECSAAGFPHLYYYSNPDMIFQFLRKCEEKHVEE